MTYIKGLKDYVIDATEKFEHQKVLVYLINFQTNH